MADINAMASNFEALLPTFPNVPVRRDHVRSVDKLIGYFDRVYVSGEDLFGDFTVTEPDALEKFERGTFRSRSIEIGPYEANNGSITFPAVLGLAMVDIPAVEGLFQRFDPSEEIDNMTQEEIDFLVAAAYAQAIDDADSTTDETITHAVAMGYAQADLDVRSEFADDPDKAPFLFRLGSDESSADFPAVQRRLDALTLFYTEQTETARVSFVDALVNDNKIGAPQRDDLLVFTQSLTPEQFTAFQSTYSSAPKLGLLGDNSGGGGPGSGNSDGDAKAAELETARETVAMHARSGMTTEQVEATDSFKLMTSLEAKLNQENA